MDAWGASWPSPNGDYGGGFSGELSTAPLTPPRPPRRDRKSERVPVEMGAGLRQRGASGVTVQILDLSVHGFRVATHLELTAGADVWLRLPGLEACHARVMWAEGHLVGCAFERPLHPAVLDMVVRRARER